MSDVLSPVAPPVGTRLLVASENLLEVFGTRSEDGRRLTFDWGQPSAEGWYTPTVTQHQDDDWLPDNAAVDRLRRIEDAARSLADEAARAVTEPRRFKDNDDGRQQRLGGKVAALRAALTSSQPTPAEPRDG